MLNKKLTYWNIVDNGYTVISVILVNFLYYTVRAIIATLAFPLYLIGKLK